MMEDTNHSPKILDLSDIAAWRIPSRPAPQVVARVPRLQRGPVWKPGQVELLWDSIFRGFPVGTFVICQKLQGQNSTQEDNDRITHHLLDGQQRANAIALAFEDPFQQRPEGPRQILWLDLAPPPDKNSTRSFLFRLTTEAHPWGYGKDDAANRLPISKIRVALKACGWMDDEDKPLKEGRPKPIELWPIEATAPVPFTWLLESILDGGAADETDLWEVIKEKCRTFSRRADMAPEHWSCKLFQHLEAASVNADNEKQLQLRAIGEGIRRATELKIIALEVPQDALSARSRQESDNPQARESNQNIANVEHLFHRLNAGGTRLEGDELAYSMIKAYWPDVEEPIRRLAARRMPESRLVMLAARAALADLSPGGKALPGALSISELRRISMDTASKDRHRRIRAFFLAGGQKDTELESVLKLISTWLGDEENDGIGLPKVLHTSIARNSPDVYLLLMWLARRALAEPDHVRLVQSLRKTTLGLATVLHWFGDDKSRAVEQIADKLRTKPLASDSFGGILATAYDLGKGRVGLHHPMTPEQLDRTIVLPKDIGELNDWQWWNLVKGNEKKEKEVWPFLHRVKSEPELLVYAQRAFVKIRFESYDPARQDMWEQHDRPWDYDHILPSAWVSYQRVYSAVREWAYSLANLRAWPMAENRSDQKESPVKKIAPSSSAVADSFLLEEELSGFEKGYQYARSRSSPDDALAFLQAAKGRLQRIYGEWYKSLAIAFLTGEATAETTSVE